MEGIGKILLIVGGIIVVLGLILIFSHNVPFLGKLPGDIFVKKDGFFLLFPYRHLTCLESPDNYNSQCHLILPAQINEPL